MKKYAIKRCHLFIFQVQGLSKNKQQQSLEEYIVLEQCKDVSPEEIARLPTRRDIDFTIDILLCGVQVSQAPYKMSVGELMELKIQLQELLDKKYI